MAEDTGCLGWDGEIADDNAGGGDFQPLPAGEYPFRVVSFTRARHEGSAKLPPCNKAVLEIDILDPATRVKVVGKIKKHQLFLHRHTEGLLCAFFRSIGARKHGEKLVMDWQSVPGAAGWCEVGQRPYKNKNGEDRVANEIKRFLDPDTAADEPGF